LWSSPVQFLVFFWSIGLDLKTLVIDFPEPDEVHVNHDEIRNCRPIQGKYRWNGTGWNGMGKAEQW
jgi:hypothetical protein